MKIDPVLQETRELSGGVQLRPIRPGDNPAMARVIRDVMTEFKAVGPGFSIEDPEVDRMSQAYGSDEAAYWVLDEGGVVLGGAGVAPLESADPDVCELRKMYVLREGRNRGLGRALMERCLVGARHMGYRRCYLETFETMHGARALYTRHGFQPLEEPMGATGHHGCNRWFIKLLRPPFPPLAQLED